jgi:hypothetical protein
MDTDFTPEQQALLDKQIADGEAAQKQIDAAHSASGGPTAKAFSFSSALAGSVRDLATWHSICRMITSQGCAQDSGSNSAI